jgi:hypothetical protein
MCGERREKGYYDGRRSPHRRRSRWARVTPRNATHVIHAKPMDMITKSVRSVARHRHETGLLDVKMTSFERSYHPRFNQRRSCTTASALRRHEKSQQKDHPMRESQAYLLATGIVHELELRCLCADYWQPSLKLCQDAKRLCELVVDLRDAHAQRVLACTTVFSLEIFKGSAGAM